MAKKQKKVKKEIKKKAKKSNEQRVIVQVQTLPAVIEPTAKDLEALKEGNKYTIAKTWISEKQVMRMVQKTPPQYVYERPAKGGGKWKYVQGHYVEKVLNMTFGWNWDTEVMDKGREGDMVWVLLKLTVKDDKGHSISKTQFGRKDIAYKKDTKIMLDYGNDLKSAATDALKKCASLLGIASDIYGKEEIRQETGKKMDESTTTSIINVEGQGEARSDNQPLPKGMVIGPEGHPTWICEIDKDPISDQEAEYSMKIYNKRLCRECQAEAKTKK